MTTPRVQSPVELLFSTGRVMSRGDLGGRSDIAAPVGRSTQLVGAGGRSSGTAAAGAEGAAATDILDAKGDLLGHDGTAYYQIAVGTDGYALLGDTGAAAGVSWQDPAAAHEAAPDPHAQYAFRDDERLNPFAEGPHSGLNFAYGVGRVRNDNVITDVAASTVALTDDATNYVEVDGSGTVSANTTAFTSGRIPLWTAVAASGTIGTVTDVRAALSV